MFRVRLHGRGGQGIKTAGRILGSAFFHAGYEVQDAPVYGAERRGAPITAHVRAAPTPIRERGLITQPDLVVVVDESLAAVAATALRLGVDEHTVVLINSRDEPALWHARLRFPGPIVTLAAGADRPTDVPFAGATCAGAAARLVGVIPRPALTAAVQDELHALAADVLATNITQALAGYDAMAEAVGLVTAGTPTDARAYPSPRWIEIPQVPTPWAAPSIYATTTSTASQTGAWRTMRPTLDRGRCNRCTWVCSTLCPDSAISVGPDHHPVIDYEHCKGCLICVAVCPSHAIRAIPESPAVDRTAV